LGTVGKEVFVTYFTKGESAKRLMELKQAPEAAGKGGGKGGGKNKGGKQGKKGKGGGDKGGKKKGTEKSGKKRGGLMGKTVRAKACDSDQIAKARYRDWVEANTSLVHAETGGRCGYVHIPDMVFAGFGEFFRYYMQEAKKEALIIDVRWNSGGYISELLLPKMATKVHGYEVPRWGEVCAMPETACSPAKVMLVNEDTCSDGECAAHGFQVQGLGPVVGRRTWGGTISCDSVELVDGTDITLPEVGWYAPPRPSDGKGGGYTIENRGVEPDIHVDYSPADYRAGFDPQLAIAISEATACLNRGEGSWKPTTEELHAKPSH